MADQGLNVLVCAASRHGSTGEIAAAIRDELARRGLRASLATPAEVTTVEGYDAVVLGSAVYVGHWLAPAMDLVARCAEEFAGRPVWLFTSGPVGKPSGRLAQSMGTDPVELPRVRAATGARGHQIFSGKLSARSLPFAQRMAVRVLPGLTGDFRDWAEITRWADSIADELAAAPRSRGLRVYAVCGLGGLRVTRSLGSGAAAGCSSRRTPS
jgi:menaquinone-dependent protoporphyrinogen oxidase